MRQTEVVYRPMLVSLPAISDVTFAPTIAAREEIPRPLGEAEAIEIWIARWLRVRRKDLMARYGCDPRQLYSIWWGDKFPGSREKAEVAFRDRHPGLVDRVSFGYRRIPRGPAKEPEDQLSLFE
jgi:hypothetical protein